MKFRLGETQVRLPGIHGAEWEHEGRIKANGERVPYHHSDGSVTYHTVRFATASEVAQLVRGDGA